MAPPLRAWFAVRSKSRHEKLAARLIQEKQLHVFLPLYSEEHQWSDRKKVVCAPLFPGYLFVHCTPDELSLVNRTKGVAHIVGGGAEEATVPKEQIAAIQRLLASEIPFEVQSYKAIGRHVRVKRGPLKNCYGRIVRLKGKTRLILAVDLIARAVSAEVSLYDVDPL